MRKPQSTSRYCRTTYKNTLLVVVANNNTLLTVLGKTAQRYLGTDIEDTTTGSNTSLVYDVWREVGDDLRDAMKRYPLEQAIADHAYASQ